MITVGWGNLISRREGARFSVPFEIGIAFQGSPKTSLAFGGSVCASPGTGLQFSREQFRGTKQYRFGTKQDQRQFIGSEGLSNHFQRIRISVLTVRHGLTADLHGIPTCDI